jgi:hypothetical protein
MFSLVEVSGLKVQLAVCRATSLCSIFYDLSGLLLDPKNFSQVGTCFSLANLHALCLWSCELLWLSYWKQSGSRGLQGERCPPHSWDVRCWLQRGLLFWSTMWSNSASAHQIQQLSSADCPLGAFGVWAHNFSRRSLCRMFQLLSSPGGASTRLRCLPPLPVEVNTCKHFSTVLLFHLF